MKRAWRDFVVAVSLASAAVVPAEAGWFQVGRGCPGSRACSPCPSACGPMFTSYAEPAANSTGPTAALAEVPASAPVPVVAGPTISLTSTRIGPATAYEWNPSANGTLRAGRADQGDASFATGVTNAYQYDGGTSASGIGFFGSGGSSGSASSPAAASFVEASGESPLLAAWLDGRSEVLSASTDASSSNFSGGLAMSNLARPTDPSDPSVTPPPSIAIASAAVPQPAAIVSTTLGLALAALAAARSRARTGNRPSSDPHP